jgi:hypothetical protein
MDMSPAPKPSFDPELDRLIDERQAASFLGYTVRALQNWRLRGGGPRFVKVSSRSIRYRRRDILLWVEVRLRSNTTDSGTPTVQPNTVISINNKERQ